MISLGSFGAFILITLVVLAILSEGEIVEGLDIGLGGGGNTSGKKKGQTS